MHYQMPEVCSHSLVYTDRLSQQCMWLRILFAFNILIRSRKKFLFLLPVSGESAFLHLKPVITAWFWGPHKAVSLTTCKRKPFKYQSRSHPGLLSMALPHLRVGMTSYRKDKWWLPRQSGWGIVTQCHEFLKPKQLSNKNDTHHKMQLPHLPPTSSVGTMSQQSSLAEAARSCSLPWALQAAEHCSSFSLLVTRCSSGWTTTTDWDE